MAVARSRWAGTGAFALTEFRVQVHEGLAIVTSMIVQVVLLPFVTILDRAILPYALVGALLYSIFQLGQRLQNEAAYIRIDHKLTELYHASPLTAEGYFVGMSAGVMLAYLPPVVVLLVVLELLSPLGALAAATLAAVGVALWVFTSSMGYVVSTLFKENRAIWPYASLITNFFGVLPPVFYPLFFLPAGLRAVALVVPTSSAVALVEGAQGLLGLSALQVLLGAGTLALESGAMFLFALYWARRSARER